MSTARKDMDNSDYSLKWNNFTTNLTCGFMSHLSDHELVDVTLAVEGKLLQAHKLVLSVCSPYFKEIFKVNPCTHPVVVLKGMGYSQIEALLEFMYKGEVNVSHNELSSFLKVAEELKIKGLAGNQSRSADLSSEPSSPPPTLEVADIEFDLGAGSNSNRTGEEAHRKASEGGSGKRQRETNARSRSLTPKRNKTSPPALREMEAVHFIKAKSEPEDFDAQEGEDYFLDEPLENYLNSQEDGKRGFATNEDGQKFTGGVPCNSLTSAACSQGEGAQDIKSGVVSSEGGTENEFNYIPELHNEATGGFAIAMGSGVVNNSSSSLINPLADNSGGFWGSSSNMTERQIHEAGSTNNTGNGCGSLKTKDLRYKVLGPGCEENCRYKCHTKINREQRQILFNQFWSLQSRTRQWDYISRLMVCEHRDGNGRGTSNRKPRSTRQYMLPVERNLIKVCRSMLTGTLGITEQWIRTVDRKMLTSSITQDLRGRYVRQPKRGSEHQARRRRVTVAKVEK